MFYMSHTVPFEGMKLLLSMAEGVDLEIFDNGVRSLRQLHNQLKKRDLIAIILDKDSPSAILEQVTRDVYRNIVGKDVRVPMITRDELGRLLLVRMRVKIHIECPGFELLEVMRVYTTKDGKKKWDRRKKDYANTETRYRGESVLKCSCRAVRQELKIKVRPKEFEEDLSPEVIGKVHESLVYDGALSQYITKSVTLRLPKRRWPNGRVYRDGGIEIHQQWFPKTAA